MAIQRLAIVGTGLIGASIGLAAKRAGVAHVSGFDADAENADAARERGAIDEVTPELGDAELVVVAVPVARLPAQVREVLSSSRDATVTDVGSTKSAVVAANI